MKRIIIVALCACCLLGSTALAREINLSELQRQTPDRLQMTVVTDTGETVTVDAPVILPEGETLPLLLVKIATFNTLDLHEVYPPTAGQDDYAEHAAAVCSCLNIRQEEKENALYGKADHSKRYPLPEGALPPGNDIPVEEVMDFLYENIQLFQCDAGPDIRVEKAVAMSGLHQVKKEKMDDPSGAVWTEIVVDPEKPLEHGAKGSWSLELAQYMYDAKILDIYYPYGAYQPPTRSNHWYCPTILQADYLDEQNLDIRVMAVRKDDILDEDVALLPFAEVADLLEQRIREGKLKSIYELRLAYSFRIVKGDAFFDEHNDYSLDTRYVLVPEWQILGFDEKDAATAASVGYAQPDREAVLNPEQHSRYGLRYELRMDAATGAFILDYEAQEYDLAARENLPLLGGAR